MNKFEHFLITLGITLAFVLFTIYPVKANSFAEVLSGYGYTPVVNGVVGSRSWVSYNSSNLVNYGYNLGDTNYYQIDEFNIRFRAIGGFERGTSYTVTFTWDNYHPTIDTNNFYADWLLMTHGLRCYSSSWSSSVQSGSDCFTSSNISAQQSGDNRVIVTLTFVPSVNFYGLALVNQHGSTITFYKSIGWEVYDVGYSYSTDGSQDIINNQNQNTQNIINNQDSNTQDIINNQNQNAQDIINNQNNLNRVCNKRIDWNNAFVTGKYLTSNGTLSDGAVSFAVTDYIPVELGIKVEKVYNYWTSTCFYKQDKTFISCMTNSSMIANTYLNLPLDTYYIRVSLNRTGGPILLICQPGSQAITDSLTDDNVSDANSSASNFFSNFTTETYGLTSVITAPLTFIQSLTSKTCSPLVLPLPFVNRNMELPCMRGIYEQHFGGFLSLYQTITFGIISYWIVVRIFNLVKDFKNPDHDEIEVMDL